MLHRNKKRPTAIAIGRGEKQSDGGLDAAGKHPLCYLNLQPMTALLWALFLCLLTQITVENMLKGIYLHLGLQVRL